VNRYRDQIAGALRAVEIRGPTRYAWLGRTSQRLAADIEAAMDDRARQAYLASGIGAELYHSFFCQGGPVPARWGQTEPIGADPSLAAALSDANTGHSGWEHGWTVVRVEDDGTVVAAGRARARIASGDCRAVGSFRPGVRASVRVPKELPSHSPGFYTALGDTPADADAAPGVVRSYWHVTRTGACELMRAVTGRLNAACVPFRLKVADHPARLHRCDAAVLYLPADRFGPVRASLLEVAEGLGPRLRPAIPALTLELAPGVGLAEDDGGAKSFGTRRSELLASGIVRADVLGLTRIADRLGAVAERFAEDGVAIDAPYLEPSLEGRHAL
jgi:hypothetical protein